MKIALGPVQYYWSRVTMMQFYESMAHAPIDIVYLGETVCSRRHELRLTDWLDIAGMLADAGKDVVLSTQVLLESGNDLATLRKIADNDGYAVEANDMGAVHCLEGKPFIAGPYLNVYSAATLDVLARMGARRWVMPLEMGHEGLAQIQQDRPLGMETEVFAYGRMPLAFSARCFTARNRNIPKDNCQYVCMDHPDGLLLETREGRPFLVLNGTQTQSALVYNLLDQTQTMRDMGVDVIRLSPQAQHMVEVLRLYRGVMRDELVLNHAYEQLLPLMPAGPCNGYWHGKPGLELIDA